MLALTALTLSGLGLALAQNASQALNITVASSGGNATSSMQYGIMFEDINHSGDGGIYAELIQNRAFQGDDIFPSNLTAWSSVGDATLSLQNLPEPLSSVLPTSVRVSTSNSTSDQVGLLNYGWWGMDVKVQKYNGSFWVKGSYSGCFTASLQSNLTNQTFGSVEVQQSTASSGDWKQYNFTLTPDMAAPNSNNTFAITFDASGVDGGYLDFNLISLFPPTYNDRPNGMRIDLMDTLAELNPSFLRLPGGNNLEGNDPPYFLRWNETIGPLTDRQGYPGTWDYENTNGLGLIEYMWWCQDLGMEPILAVWAGFYLDGPVVNQSDLQPYIQYALDELEFLMGDESTTYGAMRIQLGYSEPFQINYVEVGNEDNLGGGSASYSAYRFPMFYNAIKAAYPNMTVIGSTVAINPFPGDADGDYHQYTRPDYFVSQFDFFDNANTTTRVHQTLVGEYATVQPNEQGQAGVNWTEARAPFPFWIGTVAEAVFLLGTERNADKIIGAAYAPLFQNLNSYQWVPDLISFTADPAQDVRSTSHHMIALLSGTRIAETLPAPGTFGPAYWVAGKTASGSSVLKAAVYNSTGDVPMSITFDGVSEGMTASLKVLTAPTAYSYNDVGSDVVETKNSQVTAGSNGAFVFSLPSLSVAVLETSGSNGTAPRYHGKRWDA